MHNTNGEKKSNKKIFKEKVEKFVTVSEDAIFYGKKWFVVVLIPLLEVLTNMLSLIDDDDNE